MEFDNNRQRCETDGCGQHVFIAYKCDFCHLTLCDDHRKYENHGCRGNDAKDITSMDCPICGKSINFTKISNPDEVWEKHYLDGCSHAPSASIATGGIGSGEPRRVKCAKQGCRSTLGPSNTFTCSQCQQQVCLSHRMPEDHGCVYKSLKNSFLDRVEANSRYGASSSNKIKKPSSGSSSTKSAAASSASVSGSGGGSSKSGKAAAPVDPNSLRGSVARRKAEGGGSGAGGVDGAPVSSFACPFCAFTTPNASALTAHVNTAHPDPATRVVAAGSTQRVVAPAAVIHGRGPPGSAQQGSEPCPICGQRFADVNALIRHCDTCQGSVSGGSGQSGSSTSGSADKCLVS